MANLTISGSTIPFTGIVPSVQLQPPVETTPTYEGYQTWLSNIMGLPDEIMSDPNMQSYFTLSYNMALEITNQYLDVASPMLYTQAVYNLAADFLVNITQDDPTLDPPYNTYWATLRQTLQVNNFIPGLINAANDEDTSAAILTPLGLQNLTLGDLQNLKTPWGRTYLAIAQSVGSLWGLTI